MSETTFRLLSEKLETEKAYWLRKLDGALTVTGLPLDFDRAAANGKRSALKFRLETDIEQRLRTICGNSELLIFVAFVTALKICLHKHTGNEDIIVGTTIHKRYAEITGLNKFLALRDRVRSGMTLKQLLLEVKGTIVEAYAHQKYPFDNILRLLNFGSRDDRTIFNVAIALENVNDEKYLHDLKTDVTCVLKVEQVEISGTLEYNPGLFVPATIESFGRQFQEVLRAILNTPDLQIGQLELLSFDKKQQFLSAFNRTQRDYPRDRALHQLFAEQVLRTPEAIACTFEQQALTYEELNLRANQLAHYLLKRGIGPGARIGIYLEHSFETLIALLGVLKTGAAYVPLDPQHPRARLALMIEDAAIRLVLTQQRLTSRLPSANATHLLCLDEQWPVIAAESITNPSVAVSSSSLAYVIYTSGSTGKPKGVAISHRALVNYIEWAKEVYLDDGPCTFALYSSLAFDLTVTSIYTPLLSGNKVVVYGKEAGHFALLQIVKDQQTNVLKLTPSHLALLKDMNNRGSSVRRLIVGGEALSSKLAEQIHASFGEQIEIINEYGPTEATVGCMIYRFAPERDRRAYVPIGRPAANTQIYILDEALNPLAENVIGELYIAGDGLAEGYLNREDLTTEKFIPNPFTPGQKMYKTGDLARRLPEGELEYVGRKDEQVKYHGHRIELREITSILNRHPDVRNSIVAVRKDRNGNDVLIAYYVSRHKLDTNALRILLSEHIVEETIPNIFVHLKRIPLTVNGKVNLEALPGVEEARSRIERTYVTPMAPAEEALAEIWSNVLGVNQIGIDDNFFVLGGHSLLATQMLSRVREVFQVELPLRTLFELPTIRALAKNVEVLMKGEERIVLPPLQRVGRDGPAPLSFAQQRLWFLAQLEPESAFYNIPLAVRLKGELKLAALEATLSEVVRRHEVLRTTFSVREGEPVQIIREAERVRLSVEDLSELSEAEREAEAGRRAAAEAQAPFDLEQGPLLRIRVLRLAASEHVVLLTMHHIVSDGWSMGVLVKEVAALYEAYAAGQASPLAELGIQYADFAVWQREWLKGEVLEAQLSYWRRQLAGAPALLELPTDYPRPTAQTYAGKLESFTLSASSIREVKELGQREGVTLFMVLLAAFQVLLSRYCGQDQIVTGTPIANRHHGGTEDLIGFFANTLVLHTDLSGNPSVTELLKRVREVCLGAYTHQDLPFEKLVEELQPQRNLSHPPLFQVMFALQNAPAQALEISGLKFDFLESESGTAKFDITFLMQEESDGGLSGTVEYNTTLFNDGRITRMIEHFRQLLESMAADPTQTVADLRVLTPAERQQLVIDWNATAAAYPLDVCLPQWFESQVEQTPDEVAVIYEDQQATYAELNDKANQVAHCLRELGAGPDVPVGIMLPRSLEMAIGVLGILKAGSAYVPLDPAYPTERLSFMLRDSGAKVLLTQQQLSDRCSVDELQVVCLDADKDKINCQPTVNLSSRLLPDNLAYVIYTSGSTGVPKGIGLSHQALVNLIHWHYSVLSRGARTLQFASLSFDASFHEMFAAWCSGGTLYIVPETLRVDMVGLGEYLSRIQVEKLVLPVVVLQQLAEIYSTRPELFRSFREVITTGEQLQITKPIIDLFSRLEKCVLHNHYGPSESHVVTSFTLEALPELWSSHPSIGRPIANTEIYLIDKYLNPVPVGTPGELFIGGVALARGYFNRPDLTAEKFIPNPFSSQPGARLYKTGDRARFLPEGNIEYLGRIDHQIKIRGFRVELGEIESALGGHPAVNEVVVVTRADTPNEKRVVAYIIPDRSAKITVRELRQYLQSKLPEYMIPSAFVLLENFPLTPNGKVDRRSLPRPERADSELSSFIAPRDLLELKLQQIWKSVLPARRIGVRDNFFELGGHSMMAARLMSRIQQALGITLPLASLFQDATIEHQTSLLRKHTTSLTALGESSSVIEIQGGGSRLPFFCVHPGGGHVLCYASLSRHLGPDQPFYGLQSYGLYNGHVVHTSVEEMAAHYLHEIRRIQPCGPYLLGGWSMGGSVAFEMVQQLYLQGETVLLLTLFDSSPPNAAETEIELDERDFIISFARDLGLAWEHVTFDWNQLLQLDPEELLDHVLELGRTSHVLSPDLELSELRRFYYVFKNNVRAMRKYVPRTGFGPLTLFIAQQQGSTQPDHVAAQWSDFVRDKPDVRIVPGDHFTLMREPYVKALAEQLKSCLDEVLLEAQPQA